MKRTGYAMILVAMAVYAFAALFLVFYESPEPATGVTYFEALTFPGSTSSAVNEMGAILTVFGAPSLIAILSLLSLVDRFASARPTVAVAVATWSTFVVGTTLSLLSTDLPADLGSGFWVQSVSAGVAILGTLVLFIAPVRGQPADRSMDPRASTPG